MSKRRRGAPAEKPEKKSRDIFVARPFEGLAGEADWVALRELVPAATAPLRLSEELTAKHGERPVTLATVLPLAWPALVKPDGRVFIGLQRHAHSGDVNRDLAASILLALESEPGEPVTVSALPGPGPRLAEVLTDAPLEVTVHAGFDFWLDEEATDPEVAASLAQANASVFPTVKLDAAPAAYWCRFPDKAHVRWALGDNDDVALAALSRLQAAGELTLGAGTRFAGMFRAHGLRVPVWDLPPTTPAAEWEEPVAALAARYAAARDIDAELTSDERRARQGLLGRQIAIR